MGREGGFLSMKKLLLFMGLMVAGSLSHAAFRTDYATFTVSAVIPKSATPPSNLCTGDNDRGRIYIDTNASSGHQFYACEGSSGWVLQGNSFFDFTFGASQTKLPGTNPCVISNSTSSTVSSLLCDASTDESGTWATILEPYSGGALVADIYFTMTSATSGSAVFDISLMCVSDGEAANLDTESFDTVNSTSPVVPGTAGFMKMAPVTLTNNDSCAAGDMFIMKFNRDANNIGDDAAGDAAIRKIRVYEQ